MTHISCRTALIVRSLAPAQPLGVVCHAFQTHKRPKARLLAREPASVAIADSGKSSLPLSDPRVVVSPAFPARSDKSLQSPTARTMRALPVAPALCGSQAPALVVAACHAKRNVFSDRSRGMDVHASLAVNTTAHCYRLRVRQGLPLSGDCGSIRTGTADLRIGAATAARLVDHQFRPERVWRCSVPANGVDSVAAGTGLKDRGWP
jgi:hypothetical protein